MTTLLVLCVTLVCSAVLILALLLLLRLTLSQNKSLSQNLSDQNKMLLDLINRQNNLILNKNPMTFQNLETMTLGSASEPSITNMSDLEKAERWIEAHNDIMEIEKKIYDPDTF